MDDTELIAKAAAGDSDAMPGKAGVSPIELRVPRKPKNKAGGSPSLWMDHYFRISF